MPNRQPKSKPKCLCCGKVFVTASELAYHVDNALCSPLPTNDMPDDPEFYYNDRAERMWGR